MQSLKELWLRFRWLTGRSRFRSELADEMQFHVESRAEELERSGIERAEALALAQREFGPKLKTAEDTSSAWQMQWLEDLSSDVVYAFRSFRRNPGFALTAVFCLALGIGANTTIFSITTSFLFSEPSCRDAASMIALQVGGSSASSITDYKFLRDAHIFDGMAGINVEREVNWREGERTKRFYAGLVTDDFFATLDIPFRLGRGIQPRETDAAVLAERVWRSTFASDPEILSRTMILDGRFYSIIGVLPANHRSVAGFGISPDVYLPALHDDDTVQFYARLARGTSIAIARQRLGSVLAQLDQIRPMMAGHKRDEYTRITGVTGFDLLNQEMPGAVTAFFAMLMIVVGLVLLIACTNVASLLLARASSRSHELAIRFSLGASRRRIVRHLLAESLLLSILGSLAGLIINFVSTHWIGKLTLPVPVPIHFVVVPDWRLLSYSVCILLLTTLLCGLLPAMRAARKDVNHVLKQEEHQVSGRWSLRGFLVAGQLAVSILLLTTAFLFVHNLLRASSMNPGFDIRNTVWTYMRLVPDRYRDPDQTRQVALVRSALERLRAMPGVDSATVAQQVPLNGNCVIGTRIHTDLSPNLIPVEYQCNNVGPDYFRTIGIPLLQGREFTAADRKSTSSVAIVSESFARAVFGSSNPIDHTITLDFANERSKRIVGVAKDSKYFTLSEKQKLAVYEPYFGFNEPINLQFLVRTTTSPAAFVKPMTNLLAALDSTAAIETKPMSQALGLALLPSRAAAMMLGAIGVLGLVLAAIGLYGVLLYLVSQRTREIGLRVALGASPSNVLQLIGRHTLGLVGSGVLAGLFLSFFAVQPLAIFLVPGMTAIDPAVFVAVIAALNAVGFLASVSPAIRALRVDPMRALRSE